MNQLSFLPSLIVLASVGVVAAVGRYVWRQRSEPGALAFLLLLSSVAVFAFCNALELAASDVAAKITWGKLTYLGAVNIAPCWLLFALNYNRDRRPVWVSNRYAGLLWVIPLFTLGMVATNEWHGWVWPSIVPSSPQPGAHLIYDHGAVVWLFLVYSYGLLLAGTTILARIALSAPRLFRRQVIVLVLGLAIPWVCNLLYFLNLNPWPGLDLTPLGFALAAPLIAWALFRYRVFELSPIVTEIMFDSVGDGILVLNPEGRIVNLNLVARGWILQGEDIIGKEIGEVARARQATIQYKDEARTHADLMLGDGPERRYFDLTISPLVNIQGRSQGSLVLMHDITRERLLVEAERRKAHEREVLFAITQAALDSQSLSEMLQVIADRLGELINADGAFITLWDEATHKTIPSAAYGPFRESYAHASTITDELTMTASVLQAGRILVAEDTLNTPFMSRKIAEMYNTRSLMGVPLIADQKKLGAALIAFEQPHHFTPDEIEICEQASRHVSLALIKAQLYAAEKRSLAELAALQSVSSLVTSTLELGEVCRTVVEVLHNTFGYNFVSIYYIQGDLLHLGAQIGYPEELVYWKIPVSQGILGRAVRTRQVQFIADVAADKDFLKAHAAIQSEIAIPLLLDQEVLGTLNIESERGLTEADRSLLLTFANQVTVAIHNAGQYQRERENRELAEAFREIGSWLNRNLQLETLLDRILESIKRVVPYDSACIMMIDEAVQSAKIERMAGYEILGSGMAHKVAAIRYDIQATPSLAHLYETHQPMLITDTYQNAGWVDNGVTTHVRSWLGAPVVVNQKVVAFFSLDKTEVGFFNQLHLERLGLFAGQAAVAFENARLYAEVQRLAIIDELTGLYNRRGFMELGQREVERAARYQRPLSTLFLDIDLFKQFNDLYSYAVGDYVLQMLASCLRANTREVDLVGRYMGDEFVVLLPEADLAEASAAAERIRSAVEQLRIPSDQGELSLTISVGVTQKTELISSIETFVDTAGLVLHDAKKAGRNRVAIDAIFKT